MLNLIFLYFVLFFIGLTKNLLTKNIIGNGNIAARRYVKYGFTFKTTSSNQIANNCKIKFGIELSGYLNNRTIDHFCLNENKAWVVYAIGIPIIKAIMKGQSNLFPIITNISLLEFSNALIGQEQALKTALIQYVFKIVTNELIPPQNKNLNGSFE